MKSIFDLFDHLESLAKSPNEADPVRQTALDAAFQGADNELRVVFLFTADLLACLEKETGVGSDPSVMFGAILQARAQGKKTTLDRLIAQLKLSAAVANLTRRFESNGYKVPSPAEAVTEFANRAERRRQANAG